jgi:hypothetical protein
MSLFRLNYHFKWILWRVINIWTGLKKGWTTDHLTRLLHPNRNSLIVNPRVGAIDFSNVRQESLDIEGFVVDSYVDDDMFVAEESDDGL